MKKNRTQIINELIKANGFESYLEIGLGDGSNFEAVKCQNKFGVEPKINVSLKTLLDFKRIYLDTSDSFFESNKDTFDLIFIDGDHTAEQVERDIVNSWNCLNKGGVIVLHDIKPHTFEMQEVPRKNKQWTGQVWRVWLGLQEKYKTLKLEYVEEEFGIGLIWKNGRKITAPIISDCDFNLYQANEGWRIEK